MTYRTQSLSIGVLPFYSLARNPPASVPSITFLPRAVAFGFWLNANSLKDSRFRRSSGQRPAAQGPSGWASQAPIFATPGLRLRYIYPDKIYQRALDRLRRSSHQKNSRPSGFEG